MLKKKQLILILQSLLAIIPSGAEEVAIKVYPRGEDNGATWSLTYDKDGVISQVTNRDVDGQIIESVLVKRDGDVLDSLLVSGAYSLHQVISIRRDGVFSMYTEDNTITKKRTNGSESVVMKDGILFDYFSNRLMKTYSYKEKWLKDATGKFIYERKGAFVKSYQGDSDFSIEEDTRQLKVTFSSDPPIAPATIHVVSAKPSIQNETSQLLNYLILPTRLQYLLFL